MKSRHGSGILRLTWPIFIELVLQMLVGNADQIMVGWYDSNLVGAIGNANQITNLLIIVFSVVCTAAMILIAQHIGAKATEELGETYTIALLANALFGGIIMLLLIFLCDPIYRAMGVPEEIFQATCDYTRVIAPGMALQAIYLSYTAFFRSNKMMKETMAISVAVNFMNIAGNALFINGAFGLPALGAVGAAVSSNLSRVLGVTAIALLFRRRFGPMVSLAYLRPFPIWQLRTLLRIGLPTGGESMSYNLSQITIQSLTNRLALFVVTTRAYANMFAMLSYTFASAIAQATQVVVAQFMGAGEVEEIDRQVRSTLVRAVSISAAVSTLLWVFAESFYAIFTSDPQVLGLCKTIMLIEIPLELGRAVNIVMCRSLQACGDIRFPILICVTSAWITAVGGGVILTFVLDLGLAGIWGAMAADECLRAALFLWRWHSGRWKDKCLVVRNQRELE